MGWVYAAVVFDSGDDGFRARPRSGCAVARVADRPSVAAFPRRRTKSTAPRLCSRRASAGADARWDGTPTNRPPARSTTAPACRLAAVPARFARYSVKLTPPRSAADPPRLTRPTHCAAHPRTPLPHVRPAASPVATHGPPAALVIVSQALRLATRGYRPDATDGAGGPLDAQGCRRRVRPSVRAT